MFISYYYFNMKNHFDYADSEGRNFCVYYIFENNYYDTAAHTIDNLCSKFKFPSNNDYDLT